MRWAYGVAHRMLTHMNPSVLRVILALLVILHAHSSPARAQLSNDGRRRILSEKYTILTRVSQIPEAVRRSFRAMTKTEGVLFAEPGEEFQVTDVIMNKDLPARRLIFAGEASGFCFIHYERGGIAHSYHLVVFRISKGEATFDSAARCDGAFKDLIEMRRAIEANRLHPRGWF
jgi:hypothetical protein